MHGVYTGAGKTTTFSILTGDFPMTSGTAIIDGFDVTTHLREVSYKQLLWQHAIFQSVNCVQVQQRIGYCPQVCIPILD